MREQIIRPSVEEIHASIPHKGVRDLLNDAKNIQRHMNRELEDIETDEDLNPEAKQRRAQEVIDRHSPKIAKAYQDAREKVEAAAESSYNFSLPFPDKKTFAQAQVKDTSEMLAVQGEADGPAGLLLAINPASVSHISSCWDKSLGQNVLRLHLNNGRYIKVFEADTADTLTSLGLDEFVEDWTFNLEKDVG